MGCTSSAPSTFSANGNPAAKMQFVEEATEDVASKTDAATDEKNDDVETAVLPSCDLLVETIINNNKTTASLETQNDPQDRISDQTELEDLEDKIEIPEDTGNEEKLFKLEEVVEKVVEIIHCTDTDDTNQMATDTPAPSKSSPPEESINISTTEVEQETPAEPTCEEAADDTADQDNEVENESVDSEDMSPEFSRATRWEALADIVAELPPSLAVDPITGQIYSLTK